MNVVDLHPRRRIARPTYPVGGSAEPTPLEIFVTPLPVASGTIKVGRPTRYYLRPEGRAFLLEKGLLK